MAAGSFFFNAQALHTHYAVDAQLGTVAGDDRFGGHGWSGKAEARLRLGTAYFFAEPIVAVSYTDTKLRSLRALGAVVDFDDSQGVVGEAGLRLGSAHDIGGGARLTVYASGTAVKSFGGANGIRFSTGATSINIGNDRLPTLVTGKLGMAIGQRRVAGFIEGKAVVADGYHGGVGRAGLRIGF